MDGLLFCYKLSHKLERPYYSYNNCFLPIVIVFILKINLKDVNGKFQRGNSKILNPKFQSENSISFFFWFSNLHFQIFKLKLLCAKGDATSLRNYTLLGLLLRLMTFFSILTTFDLRLTTYALLLSTYDLSLTTYDLSLTNYSFLHPSFYMRIHGSNSNHIHYLSYGTSQL